MTECEEWHEFKFCTVNNIFILGDNQTASSGLVNAGKYPSLVIIPPYVNGKEVKEIGAYSLKNCPLIKEIIIEARITQINIYATWGCASLEKIKIPNTCLYIFNSGIHIWNSTLKSGVTNPGTSRVMFEPNSKISFIGYQGISYRENIYLYFCNKVNPSFSSGAFNCNKKLVVYSPVSFIFNGKRTNSSEYFSACSIPKTCLIQRKRRMQFYLCIILLISNK